MARLPQPGGDDGSWGTILNDFLAQAHKTDGALKDGVVTANTLATNAITGAAMDAGVGVDGQVLTKDASQPSGMKWKTVSSGTAQVNSDWQATSGVEQILNKPSLAAVATSGSYTDLTNRPAIADKAELTGVVRETAGSYPARPTGYANVKFIGTTDPGSSAQAGDEWVKV